MKGVQAEAAACSGIQFKVFPASLLRTRPPLCIFLTCYNSPSAVVGPWLWVPVVITCWVASPDLTCCLWTPVHPRFPEFCLLHLLGSPTSGSKILGHHLLLWSMPYSCLSLGPLWWAGSHQLLSSPSCSNYPVRPVSQAYYYTGLLSGYQAQSRSLLRLTYLAPVLLSGHYPEKPVLFESIDLTDKMYPGRLW